MRFITMAAIVLLAGATTAARADVAERALSLSKTYSGCLAINGTDSQKVECFVGMSDEITELLNEVTQAITSGGDTCTVEDFKTLMRGHIPYITGSMSCDSGRLNYRVFDGDSGAFVESGFTYFDGYAFQIYADTPSLPAKVMLKYTVSSRR